MKEFNYQKICGDLLFGLKPREREIISRRFGFKGKEKETLEVIGKDFDICRERVRQIQEKVTSEAIRPKTETHKEIFDYFYQYLEEFGGLRKESVLLEELGGEGQQHEIQFLLSLKDHFLKVNKDEEFYSFWSTREEPRKLVKDIIQSLCQELKQEEEPLSLEDLQDLVSLRGKALASYLQVSKEIQKNRQGLYGLVEWPEINPRGVKDKAYLALKRAGKPLHFRKVAERIEGSHVQTVHNELIKDDRFILIGRGIYALSEWGYYPGHVKDIIKRVLKESEEPLEKKKIVAEVLKQRKVKESTVFLNLSNEECFKKNSEGRYTIKEA